MAEVIGSLRENQATHGERVVLRQLRENLPKEYSVYVECPLHSKRIERYPDFIVLTNYGVIILEVKDWVQVTRADRYVAEIRKRENKIRQAPNPVSQAREAALLLAQELHALKNDLKRNGHTEIPWGYAVVLPNLGAAAISQLRRAWGEEYVLNSDDLDAPLIKARLKVTLPENKIRPLEREEMNLIRAAINPTVMIEANHHPSFILDDEQERIVAEPVKPEPKSAQASVPIVLQDQLFGSSETKSSTPASDSSVDTGGIESEISRNTSIRLVRGIAGSGKSLVLTQRARYLAAQYPEWNIAVLTYNDQLRQHFLASLKKNPNVHPLTFHTLCSSLMRSYRVWMEPVNEAGWIENQRKHYPGLGKYSTEFLEEDIKWIKDTGIADRQSYLSAERKGRGQDGRLIKPQRETIYDLLQNYDQFLQRTGVPDWADIPGLALKGISEGKITPPGYDAILIDEAQDFAPVWLKLINACLNPDHGVLLLADDPAQSIYGFFCWKEKGVNVAGRTRWLKVPYRNTYEIYQAAYRLITSDPLLAKLLEEEGAFVVPDLDSAAMRHGPRPLIERFGIFDNEIFSIRNRITDLLQKGVPSQQIAVFHRKHSGVERLRAGLRGCEVVIDTFHAYKGMEFDVVFLTQLQKTEVTGPAEHESAERRLVYMAMTRARNELYMSYEYKLPGMYSPLKDVVDVIE